MERKTLSLSAKKRFSKHNIVDKIKNITANENYKNKFGVRFSKLLEKRESINKQITQIEYRLKMAYSFPLNEQLNNLKEIDINIMCEIVDILCEK